MQMKIVIVFIDSG